MCKIDLSDDDKKILDNIIKLYSSNYLMIRKSLNNCKEQLNLKYVNEEYLKTVERQISFWVSRLNYVRDSEKQTIKEFCKNNNIDIELVNKYIKNKNKDGNI